MGALIGIGINYYFKSIGIIYFKFQNFVTFSSQTTLNNYQFFLICLILNIPKLLTFSFSKFVILFYSSCNLVTVKSLLDL